VRARCPVCGFAEVSTDEAFDRGLVLLSECPRCEHRWTAPAPPAPRMAALRVPARAAGESVSAA
jgi:hypothetical protein